MLSIVFGSFLGVLFSLVSELFDEVLYLLVVAELDVEIAVDLA